MLRASVLPLLVLLVSLAATAIAWYSLRIQAEVNAAADFESDARQIAETIGTRMQAYEESLHAVVALFGTSRVVTPDDWRRFVDRLDLRRDHPGIQMLGFAKRLGAHQLDAHEHAMRAQGLPDYRVWPEGTRDEYVAVTFVEPFAANTRRLLGYDMLSNPVSRSAMERPRGSGFASLSSRWTEFADTRTEPRATVLMFAPLYPREGNSSGAVSEETLIGYEIPLRSIKWC
jgi:CHASE1-domain containing sensor protein